MPVDAIGATLGVQSQTANSASALNQDDFIRLFLTQLTFQDPLEPVDNAQFLAQMAQFASLEQARRTNDSVDNLVFMSSTAQSLELLGKQVQVAGQSAPFIGSVTAVHYTAAGPSLTVTSSTGTVLTAVKLSQIQLLKL
jgi:flagellar basal-body rod modification protein FlgD